MILTLESVKEAGQNGATSTSALERRCHRRVLAYTVEKRDIETMFCTPASFNVGLGLAV